LISGAKINKKYKSNKLFQEKLTAQYKLFRVSLQNPSIFGTLCMLMVLELLPEESAINSPLSSQ